MHSFICSCCLCLNMYFPEDEGGRRQEEGGRRKEDNKKITKDMLLGIGEVGGVPGGDAGDSAGG